MAESKNIKGSITSLNTYHTDAYAIAVKNGFKGTVEEWLESLRGEAGHTPEKGVDYYTEEEIAGVVERVLQSIKTSPARIGQVELKASAWSEGTSPYSQVVEIEGVTENSQVDLTPNVNQLAIFHNKDLAFVTENVGGVVTVYAIGEKPTNDYTIQVTITEVIV